MPAIVAALLAMGVTATLAGCATAGLEQPQTFNERLAYGVSAHTAVLTSIGNAAALGDIDPNSATELLDTAERARALMDSARRVRQAGDVAESSRQLSLALAILAELQRYHQEE
jgi:hypothetical protein